MVATLQVLVGGLVGFTIGWRSVPHVDGRRAARIAARQASGNVSSGEAAFYREAPEGRIFDCLRCGRPLSPYWWSCQHCGATFDLYPPVATDRRVGWGA